MNSINDQIEFIRQEIDRADAELFNLKLDKEQKFYLMMRVHMLNDILNTLKNR